MAKMSKFYLYKRIEKLKTLIFKYVYINTQILKVFLDKFLCKYLDTQNYASITTVPIIYEEPPRIVHKSITYLISRQCQTASGSK